MGKGIRAVNPYRKNRRIYRHDFDMEKLVEMQEISEGFARWETYLRPKYPLIGYWFLGQTGGGKAGSHE